MLIKLVLLKSFVILFLGCTSTYSIELAKQYCQNIPNKSSKEYMQCIRREYPKTQSFYSKHSSDYTFCRLHALNEINKVAPKIIVCPNDGQSLWIENEEACENHLIFNIKNQADYLYLLAQLQTRCMKLRGWEQEKVWFNY